MTASLARPPFPTKTKITTVALGTDAQALTTNCGARPLPTTTATKNGDTVRAVSDRLIKVIVCMVIQRHEGRIKLELLSQLFSICVLFIRQFLC